MSKKTYARETWGQVYNEVLVLPRRLVDAVLQAKGEDQPSERYLQESEAHLNPCLGNGLYVTQTKPCKANKDAP